MANFFWFLMRSNEACISKQEISTLLIKDVLTARVTMLLFHLKNPHPTMLSCNIPTGARVCWASLFTRQSKWPQTPNSHPTNTPPPPKKLMQGGVVNLWTCETCIHQHRGMCSKMQALSNVDGGRSRMLFKNPTRKRFSQYLLPPTLFVFVPPFWVTLLFSTSECSRTGQLWSGFPLHQKLLGRRSDLDSLLKSTPQKANCQWEPPEKGPSQKHPKIFLLMTKLPVWECYDWLFLCTMSF